MFSLSSRDNPGTICLRIAQSELIVGSRSSNYGSICCSVMRLDDGDYVEWGSASVIAQHEMV